MSDPVPSQGLGPRERPAIGPQQLTCLTSSIPLHSSCRIQSSGYWTRPSQFVWSCSWGGSVCASFSTAIVLHWRTKEHPLGVPWATPEQKKKLCMGNSFMRWTVRLVELCVAEGLFYLFENPQNSHFWKQKEWFKVMPEDGWQDFFVDFCVFGTLWRKSTRFRTNCSLSGRKLRCRCSSGHIVLRGRCKAAKANWTKVAEANPPDLCRYIAESLNGDLHSLRMRKKLDVLEIGWNEDWRGLERDLGVAWLAGDPELWVRWICWNLLLSL